MKQTSENHESAVKDWSLAEHLRNTFRDSGASVYRIARIAGVDQSTLNKFMNRTRKNLHLDVADRLFRLFFHPPRRRRVRWDRKADPPSE